MNIDCDAIKPVVEELLEKILSGPMGGKVRCHEIARLLAPSLRQRFNCPVLVCDGAAKYQMDLLYQAMEIDLLDLVDDADPELSAALAALDDTNAAQYCGAIHSWCEVGESGEIVVDYHNCLVSPDGLNVFSGLLIIEERATLTKRAWYKRCGLRFRLFGQSFLLLPRVIFHRFMVPYVTRLRV